MQTNHPHFTFTYRGETRAARAIGQNRVQHVGGVARHGFNVASGILVWIEADRCTPCSAEQCAAIEGAYEARLAAAMTERRAAYIAKVA